MNNFGSITPILRAGPREDRQLLKRAPSSVLVLVRKERGGKPS